MFDRLTENGRCYWMRMNVEKTEIMRISRQPAPLQMIIDHSQLHNVEYFNYLGSMISNAARCTRDIWTSIAMLKQEDSLHQQTGLKFKEGTNKVLHLQHNSVLYWNLDTSENRSEIPQQVWNVVLEKDGDQLDQSCEKRDRVKETNVLHTIKKEG